MCLYASLEADITKIYFLTIDNIADSSAIACGQSTI